MSPTSPPAPISPASSIEILLIEDEEAHVELIRRRLERMDPAPNLTAARTLAEADGVLAEATFTIVIADWRLPDGSGIDLLERHPDLACPVLVMTGFGDEKTVVEAMRAGALDYIVKSEDAFEALPRIIDRALREWRGVEEQMRLKEELRRSQRMKAIGQLAGGIAHDFNNLLTVIGAHAELLMDETDDGDPTRESLGEIQNAYQSAAALTRHLLTFVGSQVAESEVLDLNRATHELRAMLERVMGERHRIELHLAEAIGAVGIDPVHLEQVLMNLVMNARDAMSNGGTIRVTTSDVELSEPHQCLGGTLVPGRYVILRVTDEGPGIPEDIRERVFEPFFTTKRRGSGTGLGLSTVYGIVHQAGGQIDLDCPEPGGTEFSVYFPEAPGQPELAPRPVVVRSQKQVGGSETILLAEDEEGIRTLVTDILSAKGYTVLAAEDGAQALERALELAEPVDLILSDMIMPRLNGRDLVDRLRQTRPCLPAVFFSGYLDDTMTPEGLIDPCTSFLAKPFTANDLVQKVREAIDGTNASDEPSAKSATK